MGRGDFLGNFDAFSQCRERERGVATLRGDSSDILFPLLPLADCPKGHRRCRASRGTYTFRGRSLDPSGAPEPKADHASWGGGRLRDGLGQIYTSMDAARLDSESREASAVQSMLSTSRTLEYTWQSWDERRFVRLRVPDIPLWNYLKWNLATELTFAIGGGDRVSLP